MLDSRRYFKIRVKYHVIMVYYFCMRSLLTYCYSTKEIILGRDFDNFVGTQKWLGPACGRKRQRIYTSHLWCKRGWEQLAHHSLNGYLWTGLGDSLVLFHQIEIWKQVYLNVLPGTWCWKWEATSALSVWKKFFWLLAQSVLFHVKKIYIYILIRFGQEFNFLKKIYICNFVLTNIQDRLQVPFVLRKLITVSCNTILRTCDICR